MLRVFFGLALTLISFSILAAETSDVENIPTDAWLVLEKSAYAARELNYEGQFTYVNGEQKRMVDIKHMNYGGREVARNIVLGANHREVYSQGDNVVIFQPTNSNIVIKKRRGKNLFPAMLPTDLNTIKAHYVASLKGTEFVAEREAHVVELVPKDEYRYSYKVWSDVKFGLMLKMALLNADNKTLEQVYFNNVSMLNSQNNLNWFEPKIDMSKSYVTEATETITHVSNDTTVTTDLPAGYQEVDHIQRAGKDKDAIVDQLVFSDGIASVSLFIEPLTKGQRPKKGHMFMGSTNMCANVVDGRQIIVVGEVPEKTVKSIAKAVSFKKVND
ncbi:MAG: MucB/RseB C-terminal domain-containing protein [Methylophilaceae bacterium]